MRKLTVIVFAAIAAIVAEGAMPVTHREATNIVKSVAYAKDEADGKYLTTNLVGKTVVTGTNTVLKMGAGTRVNGTDDMYIQLGGGELIFPDNLGITVRGNRTLATWGITNGYTKTEVDAALAGKFDRIARDAGSPREYAEFRQSVNGMDIVPHWFDDGESYIPYWLSFGMTIHVTDNENDSTAGIWANDDAHGFGISESASDFKNGRFTAFYGDGFIDLRTGTRVDEILIPHKSGTMALQSSTLAGYGIGDAYTKTEVDAALAGKLDRIVRDPQYAYNHSEFKQTLDGLEYIEYQTEDGQTEVISRASFGSKMVYATEDSNWLTAGIHASEDYLGFGISQSASAFKNGSFSIFYGNGFIGIGNNEITIPNATGTMALRSTTLAGYGIGDAYTKTQTDAAITAKVGGFIPKTSDEALQVGPLVLGVDFTYFAPGIRGINGPAWVRSNWEEEEGCVYTAADWNFCDTLWIGFDGIWLERDDLLHFKSGSGYLSVDEKVKEVMSPAVVLQQIKAMNATQKAELKAFLGIQ